MFILPKVGLNIMFTLSEVGLDICLHFQKGHQTYVHFLKVELDVCFHFETWNKIFVYTFRSGMGCMFALPKVELDIYLLFQK